MLLLIAGILAGLTHSLYGAFSKALLNRDVPDPFLFLLYINGIHALISLPLWLIVPPSLPAPGGWTPLMLACLTGSLGYLLLYLALQCGDASSVMPIMGSKVVFSGILAVFMLGEVHTATVNAAVVLVMIAIGMLGYSPAPDGTRRFPLRPLLLMLGSGVVFGFTDIFIRQSLAYQSAVDFTVFYNLILGLISLLIIPYLRIRRVPLTVPVRSLGIFSLSALFLLGSTLLFVVSFNLAAGVVVPNILMATRGIFIVLISAVLSLRGSTVLETRSRGIYVLRTVAALLIVVAIRLTLP